MSTNYHTVTVKTRLDDEGTPDEARSVESVRFNCTAPEGADCRSYPECDCEQFDWNDAKTHDGAGHIRVTGRECFLKGWFDAEGAVYVGPDEDDRRDDYVPAIDRTGLIAVSFTDEWPEWEWATPSTDSETESETT